MRLARLVFALFALSTALGCADSPLSPKADELEANRRLWAARGFASYQFTLRMDCFCAVNGPVRLQVVNDSNVAATLISTGAPVNPQWFPTINKLFDFIDRGLANHAAVLQVTYHPTLGYPTQIMYDGAINAADDEVNYTISQVDGPALMELRPLRRLAADLRPR